MRIVYLDSTKDDLQWIKHYYTNIFPRGSSTAISQFHAIEKLLLANPFMGQETSQPDVYEYSIPRTPFSYIYKVTPKYIAILRVWDERQSRKA